MSILSAICFHVRAFLCAAGCHSWRTELVQNLRGMWIEKRVCRRCRKMRLR